MGFELPLGVTGFGLDFPSIEIAARRNDFVSWARGVARNLNSSLIELELGEPRPSFDAVMLDRSGLWLLHNRYVPLVGVVETKPEVGGSWAVAGEFVDLVVAGHISQWGPNLLDAATLNAPLEQPLEELGRGAQDQADKYKPQTVGDVIFNYWT